IQADVERSGGDGDPLDLRDAVGEAARQVDAAREDADEDDARGAFVALDDVVRDAGEGADDVVRVHDGGFRREVGQARRLPPAPGGKASAGPSGPGTKNACRASRVQAVVFLTFRLPLPGLSGPALKGL